MVEDEPFIAIDVAMAVEDAGGSVVGPAATVAEALELIDSSHVAGAILDVNLPDGDISPVVERLVARGVPFIIQTGGGVPDALTRRYPELYVMVKPVFAASLVDDLEALMVDAPGVVQCVLRTSS